MVSKFDQTRNCIISLDSSEMKPENLKGIRALMISYLQMLCLFKSKINFGKEDISLKLDFAWKDTTKNDYYISNNISFEYYSVLFNLATVHSLIGNSIFNNLKSYDEAQLKEGMKAYQQASNLFDKIKAEISEHIAVKEIQQDLTSSYLSYVLS